MTKKDPKRKRGERSAPGRTGGKRPHPNRIRELRLKGVPLSQGHLGLLAGYDNSTVSRDESGDQPIARDRIIAYAAVLRVQTFELFIDPDSPEASLPLPPTMEASGGVQDGRA